MPIYDQSYRPYRGHLSSHAMRWWTITRTGLMHLFSKKIFLVLITMTFFYPVVAGFQIYFVHQFPEQNLVTINAEFFRMTMEIQLLWFLVLGIYPGTGLISNDLRWNAIQLYLSKPLTKLDYIAGKLAIIGIFLLGVSLVPGLLLFGLQLGFSSDTKFLTSFWWIPFSVIGYSVSASFAWGMIVLALSSLSKNSRYVGILLIALVFASGGMALFFWGITDAEGVIIISVIDELKQLSYLFFGGQGAFGNHGFAAAITLVFLMGVCAATLRRRVRAVEVVK